MDLNIESESIDTILCTEVLEHIENPIAAINEFFRVLRPGGIVILTVPFAFPVHDEKDYWRFSEQGLRLLFDNSGFIVEEIKPITNTAMSIAILFNMYIFDIGFVWKKWLYPFGLLLRPILWIIIAIINLSFGLAGLIITSEHLPSNIMLIAKKD